MLVSKNWKILYGNMTKLVQHMAPRGQKYQREVIIGQCLYKEELLRGRVSKRNGWSIKYPCTVIFRKRQKTIYMTSWGKNRRIRFAGLVKSCPIPVLRLYNPGTSYTWKPDVRETIIQRCKTPRSWFDQEQRTKPRQKHEQTQVCSCMCIQIHTYIQTSYTSWEGN